jgi:hypothetical protein
MNKTKKITFIICFSVYIVLILLILLKQNPDRSADIGLTGILLGIVYFLLGIISSISNDTRSAGTALLLSAEVIFLIGLSICSMNPVQIH